MRWCEKSRARFKRRKRELVAALMRGNIVPRSPCQPKSYRALMRVNTVPTLKPEDKELVSRADAREKPCRVRRASPKTIVR
ncbi:MAG: hypothetical protein HZT40_07555 [Candidatus Thiothrix singaporensis]|uniref:Uncharacterized protein n=1 Tax=Candidatus Thiothrix singaporensis TaxID=2799669 RepID=A0A7L6AQW1_9GAMM|nr:MAG: hypothetical protein HZT40_07555 [Candidatus Thiothrix singaporensis]